VKVALVTSIPYGGPVEHAVLLARDLVRLGVSVSAVAADPAVAARFADAGARAAVLPLRSPGDWTGAVRVHRFVRGADVVHSHDRRGGLWVRLGPSHGALRVHTLHGLPEPYLEGRPGLKGRVAYGGLERALAARTDVLIAPSHAAARLLSERIGYRLEDIAVVPNGVDLPPEPFTPGALVGTLSAHEPVKGLDVFLAAVPLVLARRPGTRFVIYGTGSLERELRAGARALPGDFPGHVPAPEALRSLAVLALPSYMETSGLALLEAMAAGIPAVASRVGGIEETAPPGAATLVAPGDPAALAEAILALLDDPSAQVQAGRAAAAERTATRTAERMLEVYLSPDRPILAGPRGHPRLIGGCGLRRS
jgi:glycosyltransferase involved in cell wall biosynthesis